MPEMPAAPVAPPAPDTSSSSGYEAPIDYMPIPNPPSLALTVVQGKYYWIVGGDESRLWDGWKWQTV